MSKSVAATPVVERMDLDAEGAVLSGLLERIAKPADFPFLKREHFWSADNGLVFEAIAGWEASGKPWDAIMVARNLQAKSRSPERAVSYVLETLTLGQPAIIPETMRVHAMRVYRLWQWRQARAFLGMAYAAIGGQQPAGVLRELEENLRGCGFRFGVRGTDGRVPGANQGDAPGRPRHGSGAGVPALLPGARQNAQKRQRSGAVPAGDRGQASP